MSEAAPKKVPPRVRAGPKVLTGAWGTIKGPIATRRHDEITEQSQLNRRTRTGQPKIQRTNFDTKSPAAMAGLFLRMRLLESGPHVAIRYAPVSPNALSKDDAPPKSRMPAETRAANYRWCHDNRGRRCNYDSGRRRNYDWGCRCYDNGGSRCHYDWPVRPTPSIWSAVKAGTTSALSTGAVDAEE